jgi:hypothetical protein
MRAPPKLLPNPFRTALLRCKRAIGSGKCRANRPARETYRKAARDARAAQRLLRVRVRLAGFAAWPGLWQ